MIQYHTRGISSRVRWEKFVLDVGFPPHYHPVLSPTLETFIL